MDNNQKTCEVCGSPMDRSVVGHKDICSDSCYTANYWNELIRYRFNGDTTNDSRPVARIDGIHYVIEDEENSKHTLSKGFGGRKFKIEFTSGPRKGECIITTNLWEQGDIPEEYKGSLPDNARFLELSLEEKREKYEVKKVNRYSHDFMFKVYKI